MNSSRNMLLDIYASPMTVFSMRYLRMMTGEDREGVLAKRMNRYVKEGLLLNPRRGIYAKKDYKPEELACTLYAPSYISLEYVLQRAGVIFQYDSAITSVSYLSRTIEIDGGEYRYNRIKGEIVCNLSGIERRGNLNIATPERAFLDALYLFSEYYFDNPGALDREKIEELLPLYGCGKMRERVREIFKELGARG